MKIVVVDATTREELPGIATPRLMQASGEQYSHPLFGRRGVEAYFVPNESEYRHDDLPGVWYAHEPGYESPTGEYRRVRIEERPDWPVDHERGE